jgi:precorrin-6A/cobalt-precorrin-6A reductase
MILVLGGTSESREIVAALVRKHYRVIACAATAYGGKLLEGTGAAEIIARRLDERELVALVQNKKVRILIDATHPFAEIVTANARNACAKTGILYLRFERPALVLPGHPLIHTVNSYEEAAVTAVELAPHIIFLATGTKTLPTFVNYARKAGKQLVVRIIPELTGLKRCLDLGIAPGNIIAIQGPFSTSMNKVLLREFNADVLVTKESGAAGGTGAKIEAALDLSVPVVVIKRPNKISGALTDLDQLLDYIAKFERTEIHG